jgi:acetolactate synthase-1/2/3 large subunit
MNGAESLIRTAVSSGVDVCFANPGTTEMQLVAALDAVPGMRAVLGLFEGVCTGAADGYARMTGRPALTLLHLGPGFANGIANLHNARRAHSPVVNLIGDHATWHLPQTRHSRRTSPRSRVPCRAGCARARARRSWRATALRRSRPHSHRRSGRDADRPAGLRVGSRRRSGPAREAARARERVGGAGGRGRAALESGAQSALFLGGSALRAPALRAAARIAAATGCALLHETFAARIERGGALPAVEKLPTSPSRPRIGCGRSRSSCSRARASPSRSSATRICRADSPAAAPHVTRLADDADDVTGALEALAQRVRAPARAPAPTSERVGVPSGALTAGSLGQALAALQPEGAIVVDEAATSGLAYYALSAGAPPHDYLALTGGAIGQGLPSAVGAAIACPDRKVIAFQADGSGMYTLQALWTCARESLDVVARVASNRAYRDSPGRARARGHRRAGARDARSLTDLSHPALDWVSLARGLGVPGSRAETADELAALLRARARAAGAVPDRGGAALSRGADPDACATTPTRSARTGAADAPSGTVPPSAAGRRSARRRAPCGCSRDRRRSSSAIAPHAGEHARARDPEADADHHLRDAREEDSCSCHGR